MELSKSSKDLEMFSTCSKETPNALAFTTALANAPG
jgi:hypothetical protein